jgi:hypothetical protein
MPVVFQTNLPSLPDSELSPPEDSFGTWGYAVTMFSQVANNPAVQAVSTTRGIASFYGLSAATAAGGLSLASLLPKIPAAAEILQQFAFEKATDPEVLSFLHDLAQGYTPGPVPYTLGGLAGLLASDVQSHWVQTSRGIHNSYENIKASVPH